MKILKILVKQRSKIVVEKEFDVVIKNSITIGSSSEACDIRLEDPKVSKQHCRISFEDDQLYLTDLKSVYGTILNGQKIWRREQIGNNSIFRVGNHDVIVMIDFGSAGDNEETVIANVEEEHDPDQTKQMILEDEIDKTTIIGKSSSNLYLVGIWGAYTGTKYILNKGQTIVGRDPESCDVVLDKQINGKSDTTISRQHLKITFSNNKYTIQDRRSKLRTWLNNTKIDEDDIFELKENDEISIYTPNQKIVFRVCREGKINYSLPKKVPVFNIKILPKLVRIFLATVTVLSLCLMISTCSTISLLQKEIKTVKISKPRTLKTPLDFSSFDKNSSEIFLDYDQQSSEVFNYVIFNGNNELLSLSINFKNIIWENQSLNIVKSSRILFEDLNDDNISEICFITQNSNLRIIDSSTGIEQYQSEVLGGNLICSPVFIRSGSKSYLVTGNRDGYVFVGEMYDPINFAIQWNTINIGSRISDALSFSNIDGQAGEELIIPTDNGLIKIIDLISRNIVNTVYINELFGQAKNSSYESHSIVSPIVFCDFTEDGRPEFLFQTRQYGSLIYNYDSDLWYWYISKSFEYPLPTKMISPAIYDFNKDGLDDVLLFWPYQTIEVIDGKSINEKSANYIWQVNQDDSFNISQNSKISFIDFNKDGVLDVVGTINNYLVIFNGRNGKIMFRSESEVSNLIPIFGDLNGDKYSEILTLNKIGNIQIFTTNIEIPKSTILLSQKNSNTKILSKLESVMDTKPFIIRLIIWQILFFLSIILNFLLIYRRKMNIKRTG